MKGAKKKTKAIPLSMRGKKRYVLLELLCKEKLDERAVNEALKETFLSLYGSLGVAKQRLQLIEFNAANAKAIVRCALPCLNEVKAGLLFLKEIDGKKAVPSVVAVSGSLRKVRELQQ